MVGRFLKVNCWSRKRIYSLTDTVWDGDFQRSRVPIHIQIKKTFLTYVGNVFFLCS